MASVRAALKAATSELVCDVSSELRLNATKLGAATMDKTATIASVTISSIRVKPRTGKARGRAFLVIMASTV